MMPELHEAAKNGDLRAIKKLIRKGADPNTPSEDDYGDTPIHTAIEYGHLYIAEWFLNNGVSVNDETALGKIPLHTAVAYGLPEFVKYLLSKGSNIDARMHGLEGKTSLHCAVQEGHIAVLRVLIENGADVNAETDSNHATPLQWAAFYGSVECVKILIACERLQPTTKFEHPIHLAITSDHVDIVKVLLDHGADINVRNSRGLSPLYMATNQNMYDLSKLLVQRGAKVNDFCGTYRRTPLHCAAYLGNTKLCKVLVENGADINVQSEDASLTPLGYALLHDKLDTYKFLLRASGEDVSAQDDSGNAHIHRAAGHRSAAILKWLLDEGISPNVLNKYRKTPLYISVNNYKEEVTKMLIEYGAEVNWKHENDITILHDTVCKGNVELMNYLLDNGADIEAVTSQKVSSVHFAVECRRFECLKGLASRGAKLTNAEEVGDKSTPLHLAAMCGFAEIVEFLLEENVPVDIENGQGLTSLHLSVKFTNVVNILIEKGANINARNEDILGIIPLHSAISAGNFNVMKLLLEHGADMYVPCALDQQMPVHWAAKCGEFQCLKMMADLGCDLSVETKDAFGDTPIHFAARMGHLEIVEWLLESGIPREIKNKKGMSPLHVSVYYGQTEMIKYLLEKKAEVNVESFGSDACTPLHIAAYRGHLSVLYMLINHNADPNYVIAPYHTTAMHYAIRGNNVDCLEALITCGGNAKIYIDGGKGDPLLLLAIKQRNEDIVRFLLDSEVPPDFGNVLGFTPMHYAATSGNENITNLLLDKGVCVNTASFKCNDKTPLHFAIDHEHVNLCKLLIRRGADLTVYTQDRQKLVHYAALRGKLNCLKELVKSGCDINDPMLSPIGDLPIHLAASKGYLYIVEWLLDIGVPVDAPNNLGHTALHSAAYEGHKEVVEMLLSRKASVTAAVRNFDDRTALHLAARGGHNLIVSLLVRMGADIDALTTDKWQTPLHWAALEGNFATVKVLAELGADLNVRDKSGCTPMRLAKRSQRWSVVNYLYNLAKKKRTEL